jgi:hypothetical protein
MSMPRELRIAVSSFFGFWTFVLCALWLRSYSNWDCLSRNNGVTIRHARGNFEFTSNNGHVRLSYVDVSPLCGSAEVNWYLGSGVATDWVPRKMLETFPNGIQVSCHFAYLAFTLLAVTTWPVLTLLPSFRRFSLRTILIATTTVALILGIAAWMIR